MTMLFSYFELGASLFILILAFYIFNRHYACRIARFYARLALVCFLAAIFTYSMRIAFTLEIAEFINRISITFWIFAFPMFVHFALLFTQRDARLKNGFVTLTLYLPAIILSSVFMFTNTMYSRYEIQNIGIISQPGPAYWGFVIYGTLFSVWGLALFINYALTAPQKIERLQSWFISIGSLVPLAIGMLADEVLPLIMGYRVVFPLGVFALAIMNAAIFAAMRRYSLFAITPALAADTIIRTMPDPMLVTDLEGRILLSNDEADKLFHCREEDLDGCNLRASFKDPAKYDQLYKEVVDKSQEIIRYPAQIIDPRGELLEVLINANKLRDSLGATLGVVYIIRDQSV